MKILRIQYNSGAVWAIPANIIADDRAKYYSKRDPDTTYQEEYDFCIDDEYELWDWFRGNMNWTEIEEYSLVDG